MEEYIGRANTVEVQGVVDKGISVKNKHKSKIRSCSTDTHARADVVPTKLGIILLLPSTYFSPRRGLPNYFFFEIPE